jgi:hypothetical protein
MRKRAIIALAIAGLVAARLPAHGTAGEDPEAMITRAVAVILNHSSLQEDSVASLVNVLKASLLILPATPYAGEYRAKIESATKDLGETSLFNDQAYKDLSAAYRLVAAGDDWKFPEVLIKARSETSVAAIERATIYCQADIDSALTELKAGRRECASRHLVHFVLMVITPMER